MSHPVLTAILLSATILARPFAAQTVPTTNSPAQGQADRRFPLHAEILTEIKQYEEVLRRMESTGASDTEIAQTWLKLGALYEDLGFNQKAEDAFHHAIQTLPPGPDATRAAALRALCILYSQTGRPSEAVHAGLEALSAYEALSDRIGTARCWGDLADLYVQLHQIKKAFVYAQRAVNALADDWKAEAQARIDALHSLAFVYCAQNDFTRAAALFRKSLQIARAADGEAGVSVGIESFMLGIALWRGGDLDDAAEALAPGMDRIRLSFGWGIRCLSMQPSSTRPFCGNGARQNRPPLWNAKRRRQPLRWTRAASPACRFPGAQPRCGRRLVSIRLASTARLPPATQLDCRKSKRLGGSELVLSPIWRQAPHVSAQADWIAKACIFRSIPTYS